MTVLDRRDLPLRPPPPAEAFSRLEVLDVLRGSALVGALVVNLAVFSADGGSPGARNRYEWWLATAREVLTDGKWYPVFAFLFGYSLALQLRGQIPLAQRRRRVARRLGILAVIGVAHGLLLYRWDILFAYAVLGTILYRERKRATRTLLVWSGLLLLLGAWLATEPTISPERFGLTRTAGPPAIEIYRNGSLADVVDLHVRNHAWNLVNEVLAQWPYVLAMMVLGLLAERHLVLVLAQPRERIVRRVLVAAGMAALVWNTIVESTELEGDTRVMAIVGTLALVIQPIGFLAWVSGSTRCGALRRRLAVLGRLSLTNYLVQSLVSTTLLFGYGFGLGPRFDPLTQTIACMVIIVVQYEFSAWWLARHDRGPVESVVAWWTHGGGGRAC